TATFAGTTTVAAQNGVANFTGLSIAQAGTGYTLAATSGTFAGIVSGSFNVSPAAASRLVFTLQPGNTTAGNTFNTTVTALDPLGNIATAFNGSVQLAIGANPGQGT